MNLRNLSIVLLLSMGVSGLDARNNGCDTACNTDCKTDCSTDCNDACSFDCNSDCNDCGVISDCKGGSATSTFFRPRPATTDLTYRNANTFYDLRHDARCNFFTWTSTWFFKQSVKGRCLGAGFFGKNPLRFAEADLTVGDVNSLNLDLGSETGDGFASTVALSPRRREIGWLSQFYFNLDCCANGLWSDVSFAVVQARHDLCLREDVTEANEIVLNEGEVAADQNVRTRLADLNTFALCRKKTGVDDVLVRVGYNWNYCGNDTVGIYGLGLIPTGKKLDNARWFQPLVGSRHGGIGFGVTADYTVWSDECSNSDLVLMTELLYQFKLKHKENRVFDLNNGSNSRFLQAAPENDTNAAQSMVANLTHCVDVKPRNFLEWWFAARYQWCNFGFEASYNLFYRDRERICPPCPFDFGPEGEVLGIYAMGCAAPLTSQSTATIGQTQEERAAVGQDAAFVPLTTADVNFSSAAAKKALSHTFAGNLSYSNVAWDCYPFTVSFGGRYEFVSNKFRRSTLQGWSVFGTAGFSF